MGNEAIRGIDQLFVCFVNLGVYLVDFVRAELAITAGRLIQKIPLRAPETLLDAGILWEMENMATLN